MPFFNSLLQASLGKARFPRQCGPNAHEANEPLCWRENRRHRQDGKEVHQPQFCFAIFLTSVVNKFWLDKLGLYFNVY